MVLSGRVQCTGSLIKQMNGARWHRGGHPSCHQGGRLSVAPPFILCNGSLSLELVGLVTLLVAGFQTTSNASYYFKTILSKLVCFLMPLPFQGEVLRTKVKKICEGFHAAVYACPEVTFVP